jgi:hypothetical protein
MRQTIDDWGTEEIVVQERLDALQVALFELGFTDPLIDCEVHVTITVQSRSQEVDNKATLSAVVDFDNMVLDEIKGEQNVSADPEISDLQVACLMSQIGTLLKNMEI